MTVTVGTLADDGPGISADGAELLFESGYSTADSTGLGLEIVDQITKAHG